MSASWRCLVNIFFATNIFFTLYQGSKFLRHLLEGVKYFSPKTKVMGEISKRILRSYLSFLDFKIVRLNIFKSKYFNVILMNQQISKLGLNGKIKLWLLEIFFWNLSKQWTYQPPKNVRLIKIREMGPGWAKVKLWDKE